MPKCWPGGLLRSRRDGSANPRPGWSAGVEGHRRHVAERRRPRGRRTPGRASTDSSSRRQANGSDNFAAEVAADGPLGHWRMSESPGQPAADSSPNNNSGTYNGGIRLGQSGFHGGDHAALFDGATGIVRRRAPQGPQQREPQSPHHHDGGQGQMGRPHRRPAAHPREGELRRDDPVRPEHPARWARLRGAALSDRRQLLQQRRRHEHGRGRGGRRDAHRGHLRWPGGPDLPQRRPRQRSGPGQRRADRHVEGGSDRRRARARHRGSDGVLLRPDPFSGGRDPDLQGADRRGGPLPVGPFRRAGPRSLPVATSRRAGCSSTP